MNFRLKGALPFYCTLRFMGNGSLQELGSAYRSRFPGDIIKRITVDAEPLDSTALGYDRVALVKMDVEGSEYRCLLGLQESIASRKVARVVLEVNRELLGRDWVALSELLRVYKSEMRASFYTLSIQGQPIPTELETILEQPFVHAVVVDLAQEVAKR